MMEEKLKAEYPEATDAERTRFLKASQGAKKGDEEVLSGAGALLEEFLDWRSCYGLDYAKADVEDKDDGSVWKFALEKAVGIQVSMRRAKERKEQEAEKAKATSEESNKVDYDANINETLNEHDDSQTSKEDSEGDKDEEGLGSVQLNDIEREQLQLPQFCFFHRNGDGVPLTDKNGCKIIHVLSALIDRKVAQAPFYAEATSFYLDRITDRESDEKYTIVVDMRSGEGWPNTPAYMMVKFINTLVGVLQRRFPERVQSMLLFPMPWGTITIWSAVKHIFKSDVLERVVLVSGPANNTSPLPKEALSEHVDGAYLDQMEACRSDNIKSGESVGTK